MKLYSIFLLILMAGFMIILPSIVNAEVQTLGTFKQGDCISLMQTCGNCSYVNVSTVNQPNGTYLTFNEPMTQQGTFYNFTYCNTSQTGEYIYNTESEGTVAPVNFYITVNGRETAGSGVIVLFVVLFIVLLTFNAILAIYSIGHLTKLDFDLIDLATNFGVMFGLVGFYYLQDYYLGNPSINEFMSWYLAVAGIMFVIIPVIALILSIFVGVLGKQQYNPNIPNKFRWRRA